MSNKLKSRLLEKTANLADKVASAPRQSISDQPPVTMPGQLGAFRLEAQKYLEQIHLLQMELDEAKKSGHHSDNHIKELNNKLDQINEKLGNALILPIDRLLSSKLQTRKLDLSRVNELADHLSNNELTTPIVVRPSNTDIDKFEIIAGHHRVEAFKKLGRTEIEAILRPMSDEEAQKHIFFDNLMAPDLPDFEKYKGFAAIRQRTGQSYESLAKDAGISKTLVVFYFAFEKLPQKALDILKQHPGILGANAAQKIAALKANDDKIAIGLKKIINNELDQKSIITFLKGGDIHKAKIDTREQIFKLNGKTICRLQNKDDKTFTLKFDKDFDSSSWHQKLTAFIKGESGSTS